MANEQIIVTQYNHGLELQVQFLDSKKRPIPKSEEDACEISLVYPDKNKTTHSAYPISPQDGIWGFVLDVEQTTQVGLYFSYWSLVDDNNNITAQEGLPYYTLAKDGGVPDVESVNIVPNVNGDWRGFAQEVIGARKGKPSLKDKIDEIDNIISSFPILYGIENLEDVKDVRYPYGHVSRYGADNSGTIDASKEIQIAIDVCETLAKTNILRDVYCDSGTYLLNKALKIKYDSTKSVASRPIQIVGIDTRITNPRAFKGTMFKPLIPNHTGKAYANCISINVKYIDDNNEDDTATFGNDINSETVVASIKNISFSITDEEATNYNINAIKSYRGKIEIDNCMFLNCNRGLYQPKRDKDNKQNYCDETIINEAYFTKMKTSCIELATPDKVKITNIRVGHIKSTMVNTILSTWGSCISIDNVLISYHGDVNTNGSLTPRNDGTGQTGLKNHFEFIASNSVKITNVYVERNMLDYLYCFQDCYNVSIDNTSIKFITNGLLRLKGTFNENLKLSNTYINSDRVSEYIDIYKDSSCVLKNIDIKNTINVKYYADNVTVNLATDLFSLGTSSSSTKTRRITATNFTRMDMENIDGQIKNYKISYDGTAYIAQDYYYSNVINEFNPFVFNSGDGLQISMKCSFKIVNVFPTYSLVKPHIPYLRKKFDTERVFFMTNDTNLFTSVIDNKSNFDMTVNLIL